jgi:hypothetical protein
VVENVGGIDMVEIVDEVGKQASPSRFNGLAPMHGFQREGEGSVRVGVTNHC